MIRSPEAGDQTVRQPPDPSDDTIVALSSGRPPAAIAVIRSSGPRAMAVLETMTRRAAPPARTAALREIVDPAGGGMIDQALVLAFPGPDSATGQDIVEYQCHGGRAVVDKLLSALLAQPGVRLAAPGEFTRRALASGRIDLTEAEGLADLIEAETEAQRQAALRMAEGGLRRQIVEWQNAVIALSAQAEAAIDYVGDEEETGLDEPELASAARAIADSIQHWLERPRAEPLKEGIRVVAAGPPNAGKSSLINALAGSDRAIVTDVPGTTRDIIEIPVAVDGLPFVLVDTAGLRDSEDEVERIGIARAEREAERADLLLWLGDAGRLPEHPRVTTLFPKADLPGRGDAPSGTLAVSSRTGTGLVELWSVINKIARDLLPGEGDMALNRRQAGHLRSAVHALRSPFDGDLAVLAANLAAARHEFDRLTGVSGVDDVLDALFSRFCLGK